VDNVADQNKPVSIAQAAAKAYADAQIALMTSGTLHYAGEVATYADLPVNPNLFDLYSVVDTKKGYYWFGDEWNLLDFNVDLTSYYTKTETNALLDTKVDKIEGMGLSKNDFSDAYLQLLTATSGQMKVFHDEIVAAVDVAEDVLVTRYMYRSNLSVMGDEMSVIIDGIKLRVWNRNSTYLSADLTTAEEGASKVITCRRQTIYNSSIEGATWQNYTITNTSTVIDNTIYGDSNDYSLYELVIDNHWWEVNF
jgi:hypothetical protein